MIKEKLKHIKSGKLSAKENIENFLKLIKENRKINAFIYVNKDAVHKTFAQWQAYEGGAYDKNGDYRFA